MDVMCLHDCMPLIIPIESVFLIAESFSPPSSYKQSAQSGTMLMHCDGELVKGANI